MGALLNLFAVIGLQPDFGNDQIWARRYFKRGETCAEPQAHESCMMSGYITWNVSHFNLISYRIYDFQVL